MGDNAIIKPLSGSEPYFSNDFVIEFDAYFDQVMRSITYQGYRLRFWDGGQDRKRASENAELSFSPIKFYRHGAGFNYKDRGDGKGQEHKNHLTELKGKDPLWRHILLDYNDGKLKVLMDEELILNIPNYQFTPECFRFEHSRTREKLH